MVLTEEQSRQVAENEKLIYWYINHKGLELSEWYGLLAIELCKTIVKYDSSQGSLANYFKIRCDGVVAKEFRKSKAKKRLHFPVEYADDMMGECADIKLVELLSWVKGEESDILNLKLQGYSQKEIANMIGVSQSYVSRILGELRLKFALDRSMEAN